MNGGAYYMLYFYVSIPENNVHVYAIAVMPLPLPLTQPSFAAGRTIEPVILPEGGSRRWKAGSTW